MSIQTEKALLIKRLHGTIYGILPKTSADMVIYNDSTVADILDNLPSDLINNSIISSSSGITNIETITQDEYDALESPDSSTIYIIEG